MVVDRFRVQTLLVFFVGRKDGGGIRSRPLRAVAALKVSDPLSDEKGVFLKNKNNAKEMVKKIEILKHILNKYSSHEYILGMTLRFSRLSTNKL